MQLIGCSIPTSEERVLPSSSMLQVKPLLSSSSAVVISASANNRRFLSARMFRRFTRSTESKTSADSPSLLDNQTKHRHQRHCRLKPQHQQRHRNKDGKSSSSLLGVTGDRIGCQDSFVSLSSSTVSSVSSTVSDNSSDVSDSEASTSSTDTSTTTPTSSSTSSASHKAHDISKKIPPDQIIDKSKNVAKQSKTGIIYAGPSTMVAKLRRKRQQRADTGVPSLHGRADASSAGSITGAGPSGFLVGQNESGPPIRQNVSEKFAQVICK
ncbi:unnamed protein product [Protopolystoma xenopodis]|uniref:Uncharacterized protein n=1 Tax=Protopolystoma xenopodis TaxID=117903 RepID=A0A448WEC0_9PLAT|nr:unnamed protein product [Protopolystoma xenopodis]